MIQVSGYTELLKTPGVGRVLFSQLVARFPFGMLPLILLLHIELIFGSYGAGGLLLAIYSIGQAISGPASSRLMGNFGMRPVLIVTTIVCTFSVSALSYNGFNLQTYMIIGFIAGLSNPPIQPAVRTLYPKMVTSKKLTPLFSLDASAQEIIWVVGPVVATFTAIQISPVIAIWACVVLMVVGGAWFISSPELGKVKIPRSRKRLGLVLKKPPVIIATITGFLMIGGAAAIEAGVVAVFGHDGPEAGIVLAIFSVGSLAAGLALGKLPIGPWALTRRLAIFTVGTALAAFVMDFWWLSVTLLIAGFGIAPALAAMFTMVASSLKFSETAEAYGWVGTGQLIGAALGSAIAGFLIDGFGAAGAIWAAAVLLVLSVIFSAATIKWQPDLRGEDIGPQPDTEPIDIV